MIPEQVVPTVHVASVAALLAAYLGWVAPVAAGLGAVLVVVFYCITLWEMRTVQHWRADFIMRRRSKKLAKLRASEKLVIAKIQALEKFRAGKVEAREMIADAAADAAQLIVHAAANAKT